MVTHSCILAWRIPGQRSLVGYSPWHCRVRHDWATNTLTFHFLNWKPSDVKSWLLGKDSDAGKDRRQEEKGVAEDEMVRQHHWLSGHESEQTLGDSGGQRSLVCYSWGLEESDLTLVTKKTTKTSDPVVKTTFQFWGRRFWPLVREPRLHATQCGMQAKK